MRDVRSNTFFGSSDLVQHLKIRSLTGAFNDTDSDLEVEDTELTGGQNMIPASQTSIKKRGGIELYGNFLGVSTGINGGFNFVNKGGTQERLTVYSTSLMRDVAGLWTALTGVTLTSGAQCDGVYFPATDKGYVLDGTTNVVKYGFSTSGDQSDSAFKKGKYIIHHENRLLVAGVSGQEDVVWYTDLGADTFSTFNFFKVDGMITGLITYYDKVLIFTKRKAYRLQNFTFDGVAAGPEAVIELPVDFGAIYDRTIVTVNNFVYFVGQDSQSKAAVYKCDGYKAIPISDNKIKDTMNSLSDSQLEHACATADANLYRFFAAESGQTTNTLGITYDSVRGKFYTPERQFTSGANFNCFFTSETNGQWSVYGGTATVGQVYRLNANDGMFDELPEERYLVTGSSNVAVDANPAKRGGQSFKLHNYNASQTVTIAGVTLFLKKNAGTTTDLQVRIETDNAGSASGTAVTNGTVTIPAFSDTSYLWKTAAFAISPELSGNTTYWLVLKHVTEGSGNSQYFWQGNPCTPTYAYGNTARYATAAWAADTSTDQLFSLYVESAIDGYADSKAFSPYDGKEYQMRRFQTIFSTVGDYNVEVGFTQGEFSSSVNFFVNLSQTGGALWGGTDTWGGGAIWGGGNQIRNYEWTDISGFIGRSLKQRVRNRFANQQFEYNNTVCELTPRLRQA